MRLCSSNTLFNHVSDGSVQCMNRTKNPQPTVQWHNRVGTPTTTTEYAIVKLKMMLPPMQCRTGTN